jgi:hypothetical protein
MPGARCTRGLACKMVKEGAHEHTGSAEAIRHSLRNGFNAYSALSPVTGLFLPPSSADLSSADLIHSIGGSGPHAFAVRVRHVRRTCHPRPSHLHPTYRDDRPKRPSSSRRDAREHRCDLPDEASVHACGKVARRAICAWRVCGNCPSCRSGNTPPPERSSLFCPGGPSGPSADAFLGANQLRNCGAIALNLLTETLIGITPQALYRSFMCS